MPSELLPDIGDSAPYRVTIPNQGTLIGYTFKSSTDSDAPATHRFAKVPYALPSKDHYRLKRAAQIPEDYDYSGDYGTVGSQAPQPIVDNPTFGYVKKPSQEDIQYLNIFIPAKAKKPDSGWPVLIYLHGGWLQYGTPNSSTLDSIGFDSYFDEGNFVLVVPGYRLNFLGFLSSKQLFEEDEFNSNFGFWDQRLAVEWTFKYIKHFGGNSDKISLGGLSAGSYSTFFQLAYELYHPEVDQIIKQTIHHSNMIYVQPKSIDETQEQFDEVLKILDIDEGLSAGEKLEIIRGLNTEFIEYELIPKLRLHTFRAVSDDKFVSSRLLKDIESGDFATKLKAKKVRVLIGEVDNESWLYSILNTPKTKQDLEIQAQNYYPGHVVQTLLGVYNKYGELDEKDPDFLEKLENLYGRLIADGQVYASERGYLDRLVAHGFPIDSIYRYRISFRAQVLDDLVPRKLNVIHALDRSLWFFQTAGYTEEERKIAFEWITPYLSFLNFKKDILGWRNDDIKKLNFLDSEGVIRYENDPYWIRGLELSDAVYKAQV